MCFTGAGAVEFIINHAEVSIAFVEENKISEVFAILVTIWELKSS